DGVRFRALPRRPDGRCYAAHQQRGTGYFALSAARADAAGTAHRRERICRLALMTAQSFFRGAALDLSDQVVEDAQVLGVQRVAAAATEMIMERAHCGLRIVHRITDDRQRRPRVEAWRRGETFEAWIGPQAETVCGQRRPWEQRARVILA